MEKGYPQRFWIIAYTSLRICCHCYSLGHVNEITNVNEGPWRKATPKGSGSLPTPRSGFAATVIPRDTVLCNVKYKWNTDSCGSYLHVIMTLRPTALHSCPYGLILSFSLSRPASSMVGFWQLLFILQIVENLPNKMFRKVETSTVNQQILAAIKFGVSQNKVIWRLLNLASPQSVQCTINVIYVCWCDKY